MKPSDHMLGYISDLMIILKSLTTSEPTLRDPASSMLLLIKSGPTALLVFSPFMPCITSFRLKTVSNISQWLSPESFIDSCDCTSLLNLSSMDVQIGSLCNFLKWLNHDWMSIGFSLFLSPPRSLSTSFQNVLLLGVRYHFVSIFFLRTVDLKVFLALMKLPYTMEIGETVLLHVNEALVLMIYSLYQNPFYLHCQIYLWIYHNYFLISAQSHNYLYW